MGPFSLQRGSGSFCMKEASGLSLGRDGWKEGLGERGLGVPLSRGFSREGINWLL